MLAEYERVLPGSADRMLKMAEQAQSAMIERDLTPLKAEAWALKVATFAVAFMPWMAIGVGVVLLIKGLDSAGYLAGILGVIGGGAQIIQSTRRPQQRTKAD